MILSPVYLAWYKSQQNKRSQIAPYVRPHSLAGLPAEIKGDENRVFLKFSSLLFLLRLIIVCCIFPHDKDDYQWTDN